MRQTLSIAGTLMLLLVAAPQVQAQGLLTRGASFFRMDTGVRGNHARQDLDGFG